MNHPGYAGIIPADPMAKLDTPLLSFHAHGQLAKTIVTYVWKGIDCVREYVIPRDPKTPGQLAARSKFTSTIHAWQLYLQDPETVAGWHRLATQDPRPVTGYTAAYSELLYAFQATPSPSFSAALTPVAGGKAEFAMLNMDNGTKGDEAGDFHIYVGPTVDSVVLFDSQPIDPGGDVNVSGLVNPGSVALLQLVKGPMRSGLYKITVI